MKNQNISSNVHGDFKYSFKKLFVFWLPILFFLSTIISVFCIFGFKDVSYLGSASSAETGNFWGNTLTVFLASIEIPSSLFVAIFVCSLILFLIVEVFSIIRLFKLRKIEQSGGLKMLLRFLVAQVIGVGVFFASFVLLPAVSSGVAFAYGYADLKMNVKEALNGTIADDQEIIKNIKTASSIVDIYDASNELGVVLAKRNLKKKDKLTTYEGRVLPLLVKFTKKDAEGRSFFVPSTNSVVYTNFSKGRTEKIIIELAFNRLKYHPNPMVVSLFEKSQKPPVTYLDDQAYAPFRKKKLNEVNEKLLSNFKTTISSNEKIVSTCVKLIAEQESDYHKNCIAEVSYSNCTEVRQQINENQSTCQENKAVLASQYKEFEKLKADIEEEASSVLTKQKGELSSGTYDPNTQSIYMRVIPDQDSFVYLNTLLHELFHHYSKGGSELPAFINEGITDYTTLKSFKLSDEEIVNVSGYFKEVQTYMALLEKIPEQKIMTAYFTNNAEMFETSFKKAFPEVDYHAFLGKGDTMYKETYEVIGPTFNLGFWDTEIDHPAVQDMRIFLGLDAGKFYK